MSQVIIILICIIVALYFFFKRNRAHEYISTKNEAIQVLKKEIEIEDEIEEEIESEVFIDENDQKYRIVIKTREIPRKTYILGDLNGKYWGVNDTKKETEFVQNKFFDFNIYEITVSNSITSTNIPFLLNELSSFPKERLPQLLSVRIFKEGREYELNIHEPQFVGEVKFNRKLHQDEGTEVFGTIDARVTGYVLDFIKEEYQEIQYLNDEGINIIPETEKNEIYKTLNPTGKVEHSGNYSRIEYYYSDFKTTYWGKWVYKKTTQTTHSEGCFSSILGVISLLIGVAFFILLLPQIGLFLPILAIILILNFISPKIWNWIFKIFASLFLLAFITSLIYSITNSRSNYIPKKYIKDDAKEINDDIKKITENDTIISRFRSWRDYDNNLYEGKYFIKYSAFQNSKYFKNNLQISGTNQNEYDKILFSLKENDKENLQGLYQLFDTLNNEKKLNKISFAKMVVSFVQDIPYALVLPESCDPNLYSESFIKQYLNSINADCDGNERFGINSPIEFLATLKGDCDTRTLLLYTILAHYNYDVALLSSEVYSHSIIGINLPIEGISYNFNNQKYILWETTSANIKPGVLATEISNTNNWRISLKSK